MPANRLKTGWTNFECKPIKLLILLMLLGNAAHSA
jgi:hypothetical protein